MFPKILALIYGFLCIGPYSDLGYFTETDNDAIDAAQGDILLSFNFSL